ncbi:DUF2530 domain-containing protein [Pseudonocardia ammonioxydans]|uniref:DUF2530 domain-containing protein n=1 Tax=Pseudonocardia ammonioxydans TaxID=260086 RepID=UPI000B80C2D7|nr:DUF2530 domain-containing protein [Pseudonocardia ammonioxydans]
MTAPGPPPGAPSGPHGPPAPPPLPPRLYETPPVLLAGLAAWVVVGVVAFLVPVLAGSAPGELFWTCVAGVGVGLLGVAVFLVQRAAARRGDRSAQRGVEPR